MNTAILGGITFVVVFAGIIFLHELGHFVVARLFKIEVEEFGIGFPPRLIRLFRGKGDLIIGDQKVVMPLNFDLPFDHKTVGSRAVTATADSVRGELVLRTIDFAATEDGQYRPDPVAAHGPSTVQITHPADEKPHKLFKEAVQPGAIQLSGILKDIRPGTEFTLNWIPLGGFNRIKGEDDPTQKGGMAAANPWKRIPVLLAGAFMNLLTAFLVMTIYFSQYGVPDTHAIALMSISPASPADTAGLKVGDIILQAAGIKIGGDTAELIRLAHSYGDRPLPLVVQRGNQTIDITVMPRSNYPSDQGPIGISIGNPFNPAKTWFETIPVSFTTVVAEINDLLALPGRILAGTVSPQEAQIGGPRSIWNLFQQSVAKDVSSRQTAPNGQARVPTNYTLEIIISLTLTVGVANLLPIPALDGWRIFTSLVEIVLRRPIPAKYQVAINSVGFLVLLLLLGFFYIKDFINPISITLP